MKRLYYDLKLRAKYIYQGIETINELHIDDIVGVKGIEYFISNANKSDNDGNVIYKLVENVGYDENGKRRSIEAKECEIYKVKCWSNFKRGIFFIYDFNMGYWHEINLKKIMEKQ